MLQKVNPGNKSLADYRSIVRRDLYDEVQDLGERLKGARVLHINATSFGGGVAEILYTLVPLMRDAGLQTDWGIMFGPRLRGAKLVDRREHFCVHAQRLLRAVGVFRATKRWRVLSLCKSAMTAPAFRRK